MGLATAAGGAPGAGAAPASCALGQKLGAQRCSDSSSEASRAPSRLLAAQSLHPTSFQNKSPSFSAAQTRLVAAADPLCSDARIAGPALADACPNRTTNGRPAVLANAAWDRAQQESAVTNLV